MPLSELPPTGLIRDKLLFSALPPAVATAAAFAVGTLGVWLVFGVWRRWAWRKGVPVVAAVALAVGMIVVPLLNGRVQEEKKAARAVEDAERAKRLSETFKFEETFPLVPDGKWWHWGLYAVGLAVVVELVARVPGVPVGIGHLFRGVAAGVIASAVLPPDWHRGADRWVLPLLAAVMAVQWAILDGISRRNPGGTLAACLAVVAFGVACVAIHDASARFTDFATFLASSLAVLALAGWVTRSDVGSASAVAVVPVLTVLLVVRDGALPLRPDDVTPRVPTIAYWLVGLAPLTLTAFLLPPVTRFGTRWFSLPVKLLLVLIPVGIAVWLCITEAPLRFDEESWG